MEIKYPSSWSTSKIAEIAYKPQYGYTASAQEKPIGPKFVRITDITDGSINWDEVPYCECPNNVIDKYRLKEGDILFARTGTTGSSILITETPEQAVFASYLIRLQLKKGIKPLYLKYFFNSYEYWKQINRLKVGAVQTGINASVLSSIYVPIPHHVEQLGIVEVLKTIDECIRLTDEVIEKTETLKRGLMQRLLTQGIGHTEYKETPLGKMPKIWNIQKLSKIASFTNGIYKPAEFYGEGYPSIRMYNIINGKVILEGAPLLKVTKNELKKYGLLPDDIVINRVNSLNLVGKTGIIDHKLGPATFESKNIRLRLNKEIEPQLLNYLLNTDRIQHDLRRYAKAAVSQATITQRDLGEILIPIPPLEEQKIIVKIISAADNTLDLISIKKMNLNKIKNGLLQILLSGQVRVELREDGLHRIDAS